ncbi:cyclin-dependent kinase 2 [Plakobranchus ocellatus]|uniref:Cyclin-dependent kinase 2 n=1 Tax=Plakobranchus ocellatus TaxID=259542 RepID=A0AAV4AVR7_9GAST|nr:cyclin-dependent kinase 2 [Plakobranchus ocellatus]
MLGQLGNSLLPLYVIRNIGGSVGSELALKSPETPLPWVRAPSVVPWPNELPESLKSILVAKTYASTYCGESQNLSISEVHDLDLCTRVLRCPDSAVAGNRWRCIQHSDGAAISRCVSTGSPQRGDLKLSGPPSGQGADGGARTHDRRVPADLRADLLATVPPTPQRDRVKRLMLGFQ